MNNFDLVLWGATGFTGGLVAEYLSNRENDRLNWAIAGRNRQKLQDLRTRLGEEQLPILVGDAFDRQSIEEIAGKTQSLCSTVGPYAKFGDEVVGACVNQATDYCDLTGEIQWIRKMIDTYHREAQQNGVRIVHACGFDSIPSDIGTYSLQQHALERYGTPCNDVDLFVNRASGGFSGGTVESLILALEAAKNDSDVRRILKDPYSLTSKFGQRQTADGSLLGKPAKNRSADTWTAPFYMAAMNEKVVHRTNDILGGQYGQDFTYEESIPTGSGLSGWAKAVGVTTATGLLLGSLGFGPTRGLVRRFALPAPGDGPNKEERENGEFQLGLKGRGTKNGETFEIEATVTGDKDPGYGSTAGMLSEAAIYLAETHDENHTGGVLTPAVAFGTELNDKLQKAGVQIEIDR